MTGPVVLWLASAARIFGVLRAHALFNRAVGVAWTPVAAVLSLMLASVWWTRGGAITSPSLGPWWLVIGFELLLGTVIGMFVSLPAAAVEGSANLAWPELSVAEPDTREGLTVLLASAAVVCAFGLGLHHHLLAAMGESFSWAPLAAPERWGVVLASPRDLVRAAHGLTVLALALAAPWWLTRLVVTFGGCMLGSVAPQVDATQRAARPTLVASLGLLALFASVGAYPHAWGAAIGTP